MYFFDNNSTTQLCEDVISEMKQGFQYFGNPSSHHCFGYLVKEKLEKGSFFEFSNKTLSTEISKAILNCRDKKLLLKHNPSFKTKEINDKFRKIIENAVTQFLDAQPEGTLSSTLQDLVTDLYNTLLPMQESEPGKIQDKLIQILKTHTPNFQETTALLAITKDLAAPS